jgi:hypothetical protein
LTELRYPTRPAHDSVRTSRLAFGHSGGDDIHVTSNVKAAALIALAVAIGAMGIYVADADDAPGAAVIGLLLMIGAVVLGVKAARNRLPAWAARTRAGRRRPHGGVGGISDACGRCDRASFRAAAGRAIGHRFGAVAAICGGRRARAAGRARLAPAQPLPGDRATFYVPRSDDNPRRGTRLMYMRDLACCAGTMASYSTPSDLVRVGLAKGGSINGELAGGMVMSLMTLRDSGIVVAVLSKIAHANTSALGLKIGDAFAKQPR